MMWMDLMQWLAGAGLICFGLDELARHLGGIVEPGISAWCERFRHLPGSQLAAGLPAGITMQGRRGCFYLKRRRLAGLLSLWQAAGLSLGMAVGMMLPAVAVFLLPGSLRFPVLIAGLLLRLVAGPVLQQAAGRALIGLGCCWVGFVACCEGVPAGLVLPAAVPVGVALVGAYVSRTPVTLWLILVSVPSAGQSVTAVAVGGAAVTGWAFAVMRLVLTLRVPCRQMDSLLDYRELRFPERALQAALQEVRRLAEGLADVAGRDLPDLVSGTGTQHEDLDNLECAMNEFKPVAHRFLKQLIRRRLSERQAQMLLHLYRCASDLERIGDHIEALTDLAVHRAARDTTPGAEERQAVMLTLVTAATALIGTVAGSITGNVAKAETAARHILEGRDAALASMANASDMLSRAMEVKSVRPDVAIYYRELLSHFERIVRHIHAIALAEQQPEFWIDPDVVHERGRMDHPVLPPPVLPGPYLERLKAEEADV